MEKAIFAGGCFWCMEQAFKTQEGIIDAVSGYVGDAEENADYQKVCSGQTRHREAVEVTYDPKLLSYQQVLDIFWKSVDPTQADGQFADLGYQYTTAIYYFNEAQQSEAQASLREYESSGIFSGPIVTEIIPAVPFFPAEAYHQNYYRKDPEHYKRYKYGSGREPFLEKLWGSK